MLFYFDRSTGEYTLKTRFCEAVYKRLIPFINAADSQPDHYYKFTSGEYMPLTVEYLHEKRFGFPVWSIMHTYTQYGDVMRDPEITFLLDTKNGRIIPLTFRQDGAAFTRSGTYYQEVFISSDEYRPSFATDIDTFLNRWSKNILSQGFTAAQALRKNPKE